MFVFFCRRFDLLVHYWLLNDVQFSELACVEPEVAGDLQKGKSMHVLTAAAGQSFRCGTRYALEPDRSRKAPLGITATRRDRGKLETRGVREAHGVSPCPPQRLRPGRGTE